MCFSFFSKLFFYDKKALVLGPLTMGYIKIIMNIDSLIFSLFLSQKSLGLNALNNNNKIMRSFPVPKSDECVENCPGSSYVPIAIAMGSLSQLGCHVLST